MKRSTDEFKMMLHSMLTIGGKPCIVKRAVRPDSGDLGIININVGIKEMPIHPLHRRTLHTNSVVALYGDTDIGNIDIGHRFSYLTKGLSIIPLRVAIRA